MVRRRRLELRRTGVDGLVGRDHPVGDPRGASVGLGGAEHVGHLGVGEAELLGTPPLGAAQVGEAAALEGHLGEGRSLLGDDRELVEKPRVDLRRIVDLVDGESASERGGHLEQAVGGGDGGGGEQFVVAEAVPTAAGIEAGVALLEGAACLLHALWEGTADRHHLADRLHRGAELAGGAGELLERPAGDLGDHVVDRRLEAGRRLLGDVVGDLVEGVADGELGRDLGDREPGGLGRQGRGAADPRVHLDDDPATGGRFDGELDVRAAGLDADATQAGEGVVAHLLVLLVRQRLDRRHRDRVAGVGTHRIEVLDRADDHLVVGVVTHDLELELLPAGDRLLDEDLRDRAGGQAIGGHVFELLHRGGDAGAASAQDVGGADDDGKADLLDDDAGLVHRVGHVGARHLHADPGHGLLELLTILGGLDGVGRRADQLDAVALEHPVLHQLHGQVEGGLPTERRQEGIGLLGLDDAGEDLAVEGLDVGRIGEVGVGHDRRRVRIGEDHPVPVFAQHLAGLGTRVVELTGLTDDDGSGADDQDRFDVVAAGHQAAPFSVSPSMRALKRSKR